MLITEYIGLDIETVLAKDIETILSTLVMNSAVSHKAMICMKYVRQSHVETKLANFLIHHSKHFGKFRNASCLIVVCCI